MRIGSVTVAVLALVLLVACKPPPGFITTESPHLKPVTYASTSTLPTLTTIRLKPVGRVPWEMAMSEKSVTLKAVGFSVSEPVTGTDLIRYRDFATRFVYSASGRASRSIELGTLLLRDMQLDKRGRVHQFDAPVIPSAPPPSSGLSKKQWQLFVDAFGQAPQQTFGTLLMLPVYPAGPISLGTQLAPRDVDELVERIRDMALPATIRSGHFGELSIDEYSRLTIEERTEVARLVVDRLGVKDLRSDLAVSGSAFMDGLEFLHVTGSSKFSFEIETAEANIDVSHDFLVDPFSGNIATAKVSTNVQGDRRFREALPAEMVVVYDLPESVPANVTVQQVRPRPLDRGSKGSIEEIYRSSIDSVYTIVTDEVQGTGFLVDRGFLVTNRHVVGNSENVAVRAHTGSVTNAKVVALGDGALDLALLSASVAPTAKPLAMSADIPTTGSQILIIGSPAGLHGTVTTGIVGGFRRDNDVNWVQFDAAINPGNSGGPVLNTRGEVVGVATQSLTGERDEFVGLNFGISSVDVSDFVLRNKGLALAN